MIGTRLGSYEIIDEIGKGGMATVFRAYQPNMDRDVAIKVIHLAIASDKSSLERFQREARLIAKLEHPHLLPVYDYDGAHNPPYIVMRYLEGGTLKEVIAGRGALPLPDIAYLTRQVASALDYAHRQGVIHRDIKPTNIMIDQDGNAFLMDFGIARMTERSEGLTQTGFAVGTPQYMSPEQGMGEPNITHHADIYSLGVMVYQMATGALPFQAETPMAMVLRHIHDPIPSARAANPTLPDGFDRIITRAMAKKPAHRYETATEFADDLTRIANEIETTRANVLRRAAQENIAAQRAKRGENQAEIEATIAKFEASRKNRAAAAAPRDLEESATLIMPTNQRAVTPTLTRTITEATPTGEIIVPPANIDTRTPQTPAIAVPAPGGGRRTTMWALLAVVIALAVIALVLFTQVDIDGGDSPTQTAAALALNATESAAAIQQASATPTLDASTPQASGGTPSAAPVLAGATTAAPADAPTGIPTETLTPTPATPIAVAQRPLMLRVGPSGEYARVGELSEGETVDITGTTEDGSWFQVRLPDGGVAWLASNFVRTFGSLNPVPFVDPPTFTPPPTQTPTLTFTPSDTPTMTPTRTPTPTLTPSDTPTPTLTPTETPTPTPARAFARALRSVAVRAGSGSEYQQVDTLPAESDVLVIGKTADATWLLVVLPNGRSAWLANSPLTVAVTGNTVDLSVIQAPTLTPAAG